MLVTYKNHLEFKRTSQHQRLQEQTSSFLEEYRRVPIVPIGIFEEYRIGVYETCGVENALQILKRTLDDLTEKSTLALAGLQTNNLRVQSNSSGTQDTTQSEEIANEVKRIYLAAKAGELLEIAANYGLKNLEINTTSVRSSVEILMNHKLLSRNEITRRLIEEISLTIGESPTFPRVSLESSGSSCSNEPNFILIDSYYLFAIGHLALLDMLLRLLRDQEKTCVVYILYERLMSVTSSWVFDLPQTYGQDNLIIHIIENQGHCVNIEFLKKSIYQNQVFSDDDIIRSGNRFNLLNPSVDIGRFARETRDGSHAIATNRKVLKFSGIFDGRDSKKMIGFHIRTPDFRHSSFRDGHSLSKYMELLRLLALRYNILVFGPNGESLKNEPGIVFMSNFDFFDTNLQIDLISNSLLVIGSVSGVTHLTSMTDTPCLLVDVVTLEAAIASREARYIFKTVVSNRFGTKEGLAPYFKTIGVKVSHQGDLEPHPLQTLGYELVPVDPKHLAIYIEDFLTDLGEPRLGIATGGTPLRCSQDVNVANNMLRFKNRSIDFKIFTPDPDQIYCPLI